MANNHVYSIDLDINSSASSKRALKELQSAFTNSNNSVRELNKSYVRIASTVKDTTQLDKEYNKVINDRIKDREKEIDKIKAMQIGIVNNTKLSETQRKNLLDNTKKRMEMAQQEIDTLNKSNIVRIKQMAKEAELDAEKLKALKEEEKRRRKLSTYIKADFVALKEKIKQQLGFNKSLKTTEGRYNAIKKVVASTAKLAFKGAKLAGGVAGALVGGAIASSGSLAEKEKALGSLKRGIDPALVDEVYVKTGADFPSIIAALNNLSDTTLNSGKLVQGAVLELQNPGAGRMLLAGTHRTSKDIETLNNAIAQIKKQTGVQDMSAAIEAASKSDLVTSGKVSQIDYLHAYSALAQHGLDENTINRILRDTAQQEGNFIENLNKADLTRYVRGQDKTRMSHIELGLDRLDYGKAPEKTTAQSTVEKLRQFELKKDEILMNFMEPAAKVMEALEPLMDPLTKVINKLVPVVKWLADVASNFVQNFVIPIVNKIADIFPFARKIKDTYNSARDRDKAIWEGIKDTFNNARERDKAIWEGIKGFFSGGQNAQGGLITSPSIVGEAGPELVLPLDYSRAGRANQIINNFTTTQSFNLASNQSTPLALASAVGQNKFVQRSKVF